MEIIINGERLIPITDDSLVACFGEIKAGSIIKLENRKLEIIINTEHADFIKQQIVNNYIKQVNIQINANYIDLDFGKK